MPLVKQVKTIPPKPAGGHTNENGTGYWYWCHSSQQWEWLWDARKDRPSK